MKKTKEPEKLTYIKDVFKDNRDKRDRMPT